MLEATGRALLREARRGYGRVLRTVLAIAGSALPSPVALDQPWLPAAGRALIASRQAGWKQARAQLAAAASGGRTAVWGSTWTTPPVVDPDELEQQARAALDAAVNAFDHLEDTDMAAAAHAQAHAMGELVAGLFGCRAEREGDRWFDVCRLSLMHLRVGQSPGFVARRHCSVCDGDLADCQHQPNTTYAKIADRRPDGSCTICDDTDCVTHVAGTAYSVLAHAVIRHVDRLDEVSLVARPRDPLARLTAVEIPAREVAAMPGHDEPNAILHCERCTSPCTGFTSVEEALGLA